jgi:hypothetical protein
MMSIYWVEDWPYFQRWREAARRSSRKSAEAVRSVLDQVRAAIEERGPLSSMDLEMGEMVDWDWAQSRLSRAALESMYFWGELVIHHKVHTQPNPEDGRTAATGHHHGAIGQPDVGSPAAQGNV